jgi:hypothetical protein
MELVKGMHVRIVVDGAFVPGVITGTEVSVITDLHEHEFRIAVRPDNGGKVVIVRRQDVQVLADVEETCQWCSGTGTYSGPMMGRQYVGPCMVCEIDPQTGPSEAL